MTKVNLLIAVAIAAITIGFWAYLNRPEQEPAWPARIQGFSFSPMRADQSPIEGRLPSEEQIDADLALLEGKTHAVRTYTMEGTLAEVPVLARRHHINVALGAWVYADPDKTEEEIQKLIRVARANRNVVRVIVGNEVILRNDIPIEQMYHYLDRVRGAVTVPVSTAEPWHVWLKYPELTRHVDYIAVHMLPYWEGIPLDDAVDYVVNRINDLKAAFPGKPIVIGEVGWPSNGRTRQGAVASDANEATFLRRFLARAEQQDYTYYVMEAFDQPWKRVAEGAVGAYWGVYDVERRPKFPFSDPIVEVPEWRALAVVSVLVAAVIFSLLLIDSRMLKGRGRGFLAVVAFASITTAVWIVYDYVQQYLTFRAIVVGILLVVGMIGVLVVLLTEAHEWAEALWVTGRRREVRIPTTASDHTPMVSVHVPTYNEPPEMVIETLNALAALDYPNFEVLVIDNNTTDPEVWRPVEAHCGQLGPRFRFFHVDPLAGFKAGALNYVLQRTAPEAEVVAVIDSDYTVHPGWLRDLVPQFSNPKIAIVQAPQDYRDGASNAFKAMCYSEYRGFFCIGMVTRNERNAIIQHGTMTMVRRDVLEEVGGWAEWCITEDTELGLRIFERGYEATYIAHSYGQGLMPDTFTDFKKQRFRWAYGAIQIMRRHLGALFGRSGELSAGQRYHFVAGWLPWLADGVNLMFNLAALGWSVGMIVAPTVVDPPLVVFSILPLALFGFKLGKLIYLYRAGVEATVAQTIAAAMAGLALSHTIAMATLTGFATRDKPFFRTPKRAHTQAMLAAVTAARPEVLMMIALWLGAGGVALRQGTETLDLLLWITVLLMQSVPYLAALIVSLVSALPQLPAGMFGHMGPLERPAEPTAQG